MKSTEYNDKSERTLITALVTDPTVLSKVAAKWDGASFSSELLNRIADWCVKHHCKHGSAPGKGITAYFEEWAESGSPGNDAVEMTRTLLEGLSSELESSAAPMNSKLVMDLMGRRFTQNKLVKHAESILANVQAGKIDKAADVAKRFERPKLDPTESIKLFVDEEAVRSTFAQEDHDQLVAYPGDLGKFFHNELEREGLLAVTAPQKIGKSFFLMDMSYRGMKQRKRVAYFQVGDMTEKQSKQMFLVRVAKHPIRSQDGKWPVVLRWPTEIMLADDPWKEPSRVKWTPKEFKAPLSADKAWEAAKKLQLETIRSKEGYLRLSCHPNLSVSILDIEAILDDYEREGWVADIVVIDYADNLQPVDKWEREARNQVNTTWKLLRALAMKKRCLVLTATQVKATGFNTLTLNRTHFSEDNRKLNHVTGMIGLNMTAEEKDAGLYRLNWIVKRFGEFNWNHTIHVAACLGLSNPAILSKWPRKREGK